MESLSNQPFTSFKLTQNRFGVISNEEMMNRKKGNTYIRCYHAEIRCLGPKELETTNNSYAIFFKGFKINFIEFYLYSPWPQNYT